LTRCMSATFKMFKIPLMLFRTPRRDGRSAKVCDKSMRRHRRQAYDVAASRRFPWPIAVRVMCVRSQEWA
jgi:hypothetical protein